MKFRYLIEVEQTLTDTEQAFLAEKYSLDTAGIKAMFTDTQEEVESALREVLDSDCVKFLDVEMMKEEA